MSMKKELKQLTKIVALHVLSKHEEDDMRIYEMLVKLWMSLGVCEHDFDPNMQCRECGAKIVPFVSKEK